MNTRRFAACMDDLDAALGFVQAFCTAEGIGGGDAARLRLVIEELFTNTVSHGGADATAIDLDLERRADVGAARVLVGYADDGTAFDPRPIAAAPLADADAGEGRVGGVGLKLIGRYCARLDWVHEGGRNRLQLVLPLLTP